MYEVTQKTITMTLEEFKKYEVPKGWKLMYVNGSKKVVFESANIKWNNQFEMKVTIEEIDNGI